MMKYLYCVCLAFLVCSCISAPQYLSCPAVSYPVVKNTCSFGAQNMDNEGKVESSNLTCHYDGFDIQYLFNEDFTLTFLIVNNSNKSLLIDKSKCFVLYDGYATQLFKDVRSSRSTTFNNVQDAIDNVQTNEASVLMTIPPYSKWKLLIPETNVKPISKLPKFTEEKGTKSLSQYDEQEVTEFVIPYSYDYSMAKWKTCRNRIFVNSVTCSEEFSYDKGKSFVPIPISTSQYEVKMYYDADWATANRIDAMNRQKFRKHNRAVVASNTFWGIICAPLTLFLSVQAIGNGCDNDSHQPPRYGNQ